MEIGERIKLSRKKAGLTQKKLGELLGVSAAMIAQYENCLRNPKFETLDRIADALNVDVWDLYDEPQSEQTNGYKMQLVHSLRFGTDKEGRKAGEMLDKYFQLNEKGQNKAIEHVELLTKIPEYQKEPKE